MHLKKSAQEEKEEQRAAAVERKTREQEEAQEAALTAKCSAKRHHEAAVKQQKTVEKVRCGISTAREDVIAIINAITRRVVTLVPELQEETTQCGQQEVNILPFFNTTVQMELAPLQESSLAETLDENSGSMDNEVCEDGKEHKTEDYSNI